MKQRPPFQDYQLALAAPLRNPAARTRPAGTSKQRVAVYTELIFNNFNGFLESTFPVLRRILKKKRWHSLVRACLVEHRSHYPLFRDIPLAFLEWLATLDLAARGLPGFTLELAHYEWLELHLDLDPRTPHWPRHAHAPLDQALPVNPVLELHAYRYPVHCIGPDLQPEAASAEPVFLLVWRNRRQQVCFMTLNAAAAQLLHAVQQGETPLHAATRVGRGDSSQLGELQAMLDQWLAEDILLGRAQRRRAVSPIA